MSLRCQRLERVSRRDTMRIWTTVWFWVPPPKMEFGLRCVEWNFGKAQIEPTASAM